jgi:benzoyl-CoA 2,3-epoxidase subunit B
VRLIHVAVDSRRVAENPVRIHEQDLYRWSRPRRTAEKARAFVQSLMKPCLERGKTAGWITPPPKGINNLPIDYEYVKLGA